MKCLIPIIDYFKFTTIKELCFDILIPALVALVVGIIYQLSGCCLVYTLLCLRDMLPVIITVLIGATLIGVPVLFVRFNSILGWTMKEPETTNCQQNKCIHFNFMYKKVFATYIYVFIVEVFSLCLLYFEYFGLKFCCTNPIVVFILLFLTIYYILHILFVLIRIVTTCYTVLFK